MAKKLFVGNIAWTTTDEELQEAFASFGDIEEVVIIKDKFSNRSKGFGFVTFIDDSAADEAITAMDGKELNGRNLAVNEARPPKYDN